MKDKQLKKLFENQKQSNLKLTEKEAIFSNLLFKTDFSKKEISDIMDWKPDKKSKEKIEKGVEMFKNQEDLLKGYQDHNNFKTIIL